MKKKQKTVVTLANYLTSETRTLKDFVGNEWARSCLLSEKTDLDHNTLLSLSHAIYRDSRR